MKSRAFFLLLLMIATGAMATRAARADHYLGETGWIILTAPGCNATSPAQVPGSADLFINRQMLNAEGLLAGISGPNNCSGGNKDNLRTGKVYNRWSLTLNRLDWGSHKLSMVKPLLDTSLDPRTGRSRTMITGGPMRGAIIRSAYDADVVVYHGQYLVVYECTIEDDVHFGIYGTSSCISVYDPSTQSIDLSRTQVIIGGTRDHPAAVPELLVFGDRLYIYWSTTKKERFLGLLVRGAELDWTSNAISVKGSHGKVVHSTDSPLTTEVWRPDTSDRMSNSRIDIGPLWVSGKSIIATGSKGGGNCTAPSDTTPGCYRLTIVRSETPFGKDIFNQAQRENEGELPTNPQEYTHPVRDPNGNYWLSGHYVRSRIDGFSDLRPAPGGNFWKTTKLDSVLIMFPLSDKSLWPSQ